MLTTEFYSATFAAKLNPVSCQITSLYYTENEFPATVFVDPTLLDEIVIPLPKVGWKSTYSDMPCLWDETIFKCDGCLENNVTLDMEQRALRIKPGLLKNDEFSLTIGASWPNGFSAPDQETIVKFEPTQSLVFN